MMTIEQVLDYLVDVQMQPKLVLTTKTGNEKFDEVLLGYVTDYLTEDDFTQAEFVETLDVMRRNVYKCNWAN